MDQLNSYTRSGRRYGFTMLNGNDQENVYLI